LFQHYGLDTHDKTWGLWRIEVRFAGDVLKRRWNVRTLPALKCNMERMLQKALKRVRYVEPGQDHIPTPRQIVHPIWRHVWEAIPNATCDQPCQFAPERAEAIIRTERSRARKASIVGSALAEAADLCADEATLRETAPHLAQSIVSNALIANPEKAKNALRRAPLLNA
jgi:hypothetical protein